MNNNNTPSPTMHHPTISLLKETTADFSDTSLSTDKQYDDDNPALMESVFAGLDKELETDIVEDSSSQYEELAEESIATCRRISYSLSQLISSDRPQTIDCKNAKESEAIASMQQNALVVELQDDLLFLVTLLSRLQRDVEPHNRNAAVRLKMLSQRIVTLCHPYELLSLIRSSIPCHLDTLLYTRLSLLYEVEIAVNNLSTFIPQHSLWNFLANFIKRWWC